MRSLRVLKDSTGKTGLLAKNPVFQKGNRVCGFANMPTRCENHAWGFVTTRCVHIATDTSVASGCMRCVRCVEIVTYRAQRTERLRCVGCVRLVTFIAFRSLRAHRFRCAGCVAFVAYRSLRTHRLRCVGCVALHPLRCARCIQIATYRAVALCWLCLLPHVRGNLFVSFQIFAYINHEQ